MNNLKRTARMAGIWYLALGITGMLGFLVVRSQIYIDGDAAATLDNVVNKSTLAHIGVALELLIVIAQALAAVWFFKLFASVNRGAAVSIMAFGLINAVTILASAGFMSTAVAVAGDQTLAPGGDAAATVGLMALLSTNAWAVGNVFFGLWLIPMGWAVLSSGRMPKVMGWILIAGGVGYVLAALVGQAWDDAPGALVDSLPLPATVGEFWMIAYLLIKGIRPAQAQEVAR